MLWGTSLGFIHILVGHMTRPQSFTFAVIVILLVLNTGSLDMEGITPPLVPVAFFSICVYSTFQNGFFCVSGHEILKIFVYFTWEHKKVAVLGSFCVTLCHISSGQIGFFKT